MKKIIRPEVSDPGLRDTLARVGVHFENHLETLDAISRDIRVIEEFLSDSGVRVSASVDIGISGYAPLDAEVREPEFDDDQETISWGPLEDDPSRWRLVYVFERAYGSLGFTDDGYHQPTSVGHGPFRRLEQKPLIETPARVRLRAHRFLAPLVEELARWVKPTDDGFIPL